MTRLSVGRADAFRIFDVVPIGPRSLEIVSVVGHQLDDRPELRSRFAAPVYGTVEIKRIVLVIF